MTRLERLFDFRNRLTVNEYDRVVMRADEMRREQVRAEARRLAAEARLKEQLERRRRRMQRIVALAALACGVAGLELYDARLRGRSPGSSVSVKNWEATRKQYRSGQVTKTIRRLLSASGR